MKTNRSSSTIISIVRLKAIITYVELVPNPMKDFMPIFLWSSIENSVACICVCIPSLKILLNKFGLLKPRSPLHAPSPAIGGSNDTWGKQSSNKRSPSHSGLRRYMSPSWIASSMSNGGSIFTSRAAQTQPTRRDPDEIDLMRIETNTPTQSKQPHVATEEMVPG